MCGNERLPIERQTVKTTKKLLIIATFTVAFTPAIRILADDDGIAASPKVRQMLDEQKAMKHTATAPAVAVNVTRPADDGIAASPKLREQLNERKAVSSSTAVAVSATRVKDDGIAASPKLREQLNERGARFEIAPIK